MTSRVEVHGLKELEADLHKAADDLENLPMSDLATDGLSIAKRLAPKDTGRLAASLKPVSSGDSAAVSAGVPYAKFVLGPEFKAKVDAAWKAAQAVDAMVTDITEKI